MSVTGWRDASGLNPAVLTVEVGFSSATGSYGTWNTSLWTTTGTWGPDIVWTDVTDYVRRISTRWGRNRSTNQADAGTCSIEFNNDDARFSPWNLSGPYVSGGITGIRPWRPVRISTSVQVNVPGIDPIYTVIRGYVFYGYTTAWSESYAMSGSQSTARVDCVDEFGRLARFNSYAQTPQGAGERSGERIRRILDNAGFRGTFDGALGDVTCQATTLAQNALTELKLVADSEGGYIECVPGAEPYIRFRSRSTLYPTSALYTFSDSSNTTSSHLKYESIQQEFSGDLVYTIVGMSRVGGTVQETADQTSRALYGDLKHVRTDLICETDAQTQGLAALWLSRYKEPRQRVTQVTVNPRKGPNSYVPNGGNIWDAVLTPGNRRYPVRVKPRASASEIEYDCTQIGAAHEITPDSWITQLFFAPTNEISAPVHNWSSGLWDTANWYF